MAPALAPIHVFVKFTDSNGQVHNLEATSGGYPARDVHYRNNFPITDRAIQTGIFMRELNSVESLAVIAVIVVVDLIRDGRHHEAMAVSDVILKHYPDFAYGLVKKVT